MGHIFSGRRVCQAVFDRVLHPNCSKASWATCQPKGRTRQLSQCATTTITKPKAFKAASRGAQHASWPTSGDPTNPTNARKLHPSGVHGQPWAPKGWSIGRPGETFHQMSVPRGRVRKDMLPAEPTIHVLWAPCGPKQG
eukprot:gene6654-biopygen10451